MKALFTVLIAFAGTFAFAQKTNPEYDSTLAVKLGADDYGMKSYTLVILKAGENQTTDTDFINKCFAGHMANILKMEADGKLIVAGPMGKNENSYRGIFILDVRDEMELFELLSHDPAITEKLLKPEFYEWYGSAALPEYLDEADKIWKVGF
jgi:uncharacterized protein YciI